MFNTSYSRNEILEIFHASQRAVLHGRFGILLETNVA